MACLVVVSVLLFPVVAPTICVLFAKKTDRLMDEE